MEKKINAVRAFQNADLIVLQNEINNFLNDDTYNINIINVSISTGMVEQEENGHYQDELTHFALLSYNYYEKDEAEQKAIKEKKALLNEISKKAING